MRKSGSGRVALVTGAAGGIGSAVVRRFHGDGASVLLVDRDPAGLAAVAADLGAGRATPYVADLADPRDCAGCVEEAIAAFGGLDIVVNVAGIHPYGTVVDTPLDVWDRAFAVNLRSVYLIAARAIPLMKTRGGGSIVNVASVQALAASTRVAAYAATKAALLGLTRAIAIDHARDGIRCNAVCPGSVDTPMLRDAAKRNGGDGRESEMIRGWGAMHPVGRIGHPEEIADAVAFLADERASFVTGIALTVDGGVMAKLGIALPEAVQ